MFNSKAFIFLNNLEDVYLAPIMNVAVIGGGAAGFFAAINVKENFPDADVSLFEKSSKTLAKVKISGGGRCNVTNSSSSIKELAAAYPRGGKLMKKLLKVFSTPQIQDWFTTRGVELYAQEDKRVFPVSNKSESIINCFMTQIEGLGIHLKTSLTVQEITPSPDSLLCKLSNDTKLEFDKVIVATGGSPKRRGFDWLEALGHRIEEPVPSLFTFNMPSESITELMGVAVSSVMVKIQGSRLKSQGPLMITHWGMSGPAILKISAFGARELFEKEYRFKAQLNWVDVQNHDAVYKELESLSRNNSKKPLQKLKPFGLPSRLWHYLVTKAGLDIEKPWGELGNKSFNRLVTIMTNDVYEVSGKTTFKEEFVTCGGVSLEDIDHQSMQSKVVPNLYFAGEVIDVDGITGGYNFQAAWSTAFVAAQLKPLTQS